MGINSSLLVLGKVINALSLTLTLTLTLPLPLPLTLTLTPGARELLAVKPP